MTPSTPHGYLTVHEEDGMHVGVAAVPGGHAGRVDVGHAVHRRPRPLSAAGLLDIEIGAQAAAEAPAYEVRGGDLG